MNVGDPFIRHTAYCFQVLNGTRKGQFDERGVWPAREPADVDEPSQEMLIAQLQRWKDLVKKYAAVTKMMEPRELFLLAIAVQNWPGPALEIGTHKGIATCLMCEIMNKIKRGDNLYTVELFLEGAKSPSGQDEFPGETYIKALKEFRAQAALHRVIPIIGDSHRMKPLFYGIRPSLIFIDSEQTEESVYDDLSMLAFFNYPFLCIVHNANNPGVLRAVLRIRERVKLRFANFHTGQGTENGLVALSRV